jgi:hypothetical protein
MPWRSSITGGLSTTTCFSPAGAPLLSTTVTGRPVSVSQLLRVADRGRAQTICGLRAVVLAQPQQPAEHVGHMRAEDAAVGVRLVDDDVAQLLEQLEPLGVMGKDGEWSMSGLVTTTWPADRMLF